MQKFFLTEIAWSLYSLIINMWAICLLQTQCSAAINGVVVFWSLKSHADRYVPDHEVQTDPGPDFAQSIPRSLVKVRTQAVSGRRPPLQCRQSKVRYVSAFTLPSRCG
jgi:hypothetical protein